LGERLQWSEKCGRDVPISFCPHGLGVYTYGFAEFDSYGYPRSGVRFIAAPRATLMAIGQIDSRDVGLIFGPAIPLLEREDQRDADGDAS